jgi:hypothetical protein
MIDIALNSDGDLDTSTLDLKLIDGAERVRQQLEIKLQLWQGEWFLDTEFGTPYLQSILGKQLTLSGALAAIRKSILEVDGVRSILEFAYTYSNASRTLSLTFTADTPYGLVEVIS